MMLTLEDATKVAYDYTGEDLRNEFEQKCWLPSNNRLAELIEDINPSEIASQIQRDNLNSWCESIQIAMKLALKQTE